MKKTILILALMLIWTASAATLEEYDQITIEDRTYNLTDINIGSCVFTNNFGVELEMFEDYPFLLDRDDAPGILVTKITPGTCEIIIFDKNSECIDEDNTVITSQGSSISYPTGTDVSTESSVIIDGTEVSDICVDEDELDRIGYTYFSESDEYVIEMACLDGLLYPIVKPCPRGCEDNACIPEPTCKDGYERHQIREGYDYEFRASGNQQIFRSSDAKKGEVTLTYEGEEVDFTDGKEHTFSNGVKVQSLETTESVHGATPEFCIMFPVDNSCENAFLDIKYVTDDEGYIKVEYVSNTDNPKTISMEYIVKAVVNSEEVDAVVSGGVASVSTDSVDAVVSSGANTAVTGAPADPEHAVAAPTRVTTGGVTNGGNPGIGRVCQITSTSCSSDDTCVAKTDCRYPSEDYRYVSIADEICGLSDGTEIRLDGIRTNLPTKQPQSVDGYNPDDNNMPGMGVGYEPDISEPGYEGDVPEQPHSLLEKAPDDVCEECDNQGACLPVGTRTDTQYCDIDMTMQDIKGDKETCRNDFECDSNLCIDDECTKLGFFKKVMAWFGNLFGN